MNKVQLVGRLVRDPEIKMAGETTVARTTVAVSRRFKNKEGNYDADFISCSAFGKTAEFLEKYFHKGYMIGIVGRITTGSYEKDGAKVYTTEVTVEDIEFVGGKSDGNTPTSNTSNTKNDGFMNIPDGTAEELPFN